MENCENLKKMSFKGLEKRSRIFSPYVAILRYLDLACLPLYVIYIYIYFILYILLYVYIYVSRPGPSPLREWEGRNMVIS